jgi:subtilisin family serine protease
MACDEAVASGIVVVAAAGNSGNSSGTGDSVLYPGKYASTICVAAVDSNKNRAGWSSTGPTVDISGPGVNVVSDRLGGGLRTASGTSMATPHVAGVVALMMSYGHTDPDEIRSIMTETAVDLGAPGHDNLYGYGLVDAFRANYYYWWSIVDPPLIRDLK